MFDSYYFFLLVGGNDQSRGPANYGTQRAPKICQVNGRSANLAGPLWTILGPPGTGSKKLFQFVRFTICFRQYNITWYIINL